MAADGALLSFHCFAGQSAILGLAVDLAPHQVRQSMPVSWSCHGPVMSTPACTISSKSNWHVDSSTLNHVWEVLLFQAYTDLISGVTPISESLLQNVADLT